MYNWTGVLDVANWCWVDYWESCWRKNHYTVDINTFYNTVSQLDIRKVYFFPYVAYDNYNYMNINYPWAVLCTVYWNATYCFSMSERWSNEDPTCWVWTILQEGITNVWNGFTYYNSFFSDSPFSRNSWWSSDSSITEINPNSNSSVYNMYAEKWYTRWLCYSDRWIDNLATTTWWFEQFYWWDLDDGVYYTGATIFDLYNYNSWWRTLYEWLDFRNTNYNSSVSRNNPVNYYNKPKWLWYWFYKYNTIYKRNIWDNLNYTDMYNYCSYFLNYNSSTQWDDIYNWPSLPSWVDERSPLDYIFNPPEWSIIDKWLNWEYGSWWSGIGSWSWNTWTWDEEDIEKDMQDMFDNWYSQTAKLIDSDSFEWVVGILPRYIVVAFVRVNHYYLRRI